MRNQAERRSAIQTIFEETIKYMQTLGVYRSEYDSTIRIYAQLREQYDALTERFEKSKYKIQTASAQGGMKKAPIVATLESLRKDILTYSDRLCLNPKAYDAMNIKPIKKSKLSEAIEGVSPDG